jgi:NADH:ubiquinone oxidoreductase subunit C
MAKFLKFSLLFNCVQLLDIVVIDKLMSLTASGLRFECVYVFLSLTYNIRLFLRSFVTAFDQISSLTKIFPSSD